MYLTSMACSTAVRFCESIDIMLSCPVATVRTGRALEVRKVVSTAAGRILGVRVRMKSTNIGSAPGCEGKNRLVGKEYLEGSFGRAWKDSEGSGKVREGDVETSGPFLCEETDGCHTCMRTPSSWDCL